MIWCHVVAIRDCGILRIPVRRGIPVSVPVAGHTNCANIGRMSDLGQLTFSSWMATVTSLAACLHILRVNRLHDTGSPLMMCLMSSRRRGGMRL